MFKRVMAVLLAAILVAAPAYAASGFASDPNLIEEAALSVLMLEAYDSSDELIATGSGFVAFDNKTLVTNYHVIEGAETIIANSDDGYQYIVNKVFVANQIKDIAICGFFSPTNLEPLDLNADGELKRAESVVAIGSPIGITNTVSLGNISAIYEEDGVKWVQFTAPISSGSSGGALFDDTGRVIGVTSATYIDTQNINLAVHISEVQELYNGWDGESFWLDEYAAGIDPAEKPAPKPTLKPTAAPNPSAGAASSNESLPVYPTLRRGDKGEAVKKMQLALIELGYLSGTANGIFDGVTVQAVKLFNVHNKTMAGESANCVMQRILYHGNPKPYDNSGENQGLQPDFGDKNAAPETTAQPLPQYASIVIGAKGEDVRRLQEELIKLGYLSGPADGKFGEKTQEAVSLFNSRNQIWFRGGIATNQTLQLLYHGDPIPYEDSDMVLEILEEAYAEWETLSGDKLKIHFEVSNTGRQKTVKAFELFVYAEDVWGNKIYGDNVYYDTTEKEVTPGATIYSDYFVIPDASEISKIYCGIHKVAYTDGTTYTVKDVEYCYWLFND